MNPEAMNNRRRHVGARSGALGTLALTTPVMLMVLVSALAGCSSENPRPVPNEPQFFQLSVIGGSGSGEYEVGTEVAIAAADAPDGHAFDRWVGDVEVLADVRAPSGSFSMPAQFLTLTARFLPVTPPPAKDRYARWQKIELTFGGPASTALSEETNPFEIRMDVTFTLAGGRSYVVPAYYDGDGAGGPDGDVWRVRFAADTDGRWDWLTASPEPGLNGQSGCFEIDAPAADATGFFKNGRLSGIGEHYLRFADGTYWLKGGADDPEDFLGSSALPTPADKLAAIDQLADHGINSLYVMTMNVGGDGKNVWPWIGSNQDEAKANHRRFDVARLADWERVFAHMQNKGLAIHLVLEDDDAWNGYDRPLYLRQIIARFAHHNALIWNIAEEYEENYTADEVKLIAMQIKSLDPYDHPVAVHQARELESHEPFLGNADFDITSFQSTDGPHNELAATWFGKSGEHAHKLAISFDETGKLAPTDREKARKIAWACFLGGANYEIHTWPIFTGTNTYANYADMLDDVSRVRGFLADNTPFWEMSPRNDLLKNREDTDYLFAKPGEVYAVYSETGESITLDLTGVSGTFRVRWFDPAAGAFQDDDDIEGGAAREIGGPPFAGDAACLVEKR